MLNVEKMIKSAEEALGWPYVSPGSNDKNGIDCSGLFVKIARDQGASLYHGSNTIFHQQCSETGKLTNISQLVPGMAVFKYKEWTNSESDRKNKWYEQEPGNISHIGLVVSTHPLRIIHASSAKGKVVEDTKIGQWAYWGKLKIVKYDNVPEQKGDDIVNDVVEAVVYAENGSNVKMRNKPSTSSGLYWEIPVGTVVSVLNKDDEWAQIQANGRSGYMMTKFLRFESAPVAEETVVVSKAEVQKAYDILGNAIKQIFVPKSDVEKAIDILADFLGLRG